MVHRHLTDEEIQNILDRNDSPESAILKNHLKECKICQNKLEEYQTLYSGLKKDPGFELPRNFKKSVISKLATEETGHSLFSSKEITLIAIGIFLALGATLYLVDLKSIAEVISRITLPKMEIKNILLSPIKDLIYSLNIKLALLAFAGLALFATAVVDQLILRLKHQKVSL